MVKLKKIKKTETTIECFYFPEDSIEQGYIFLDFKNEKNKKLIFPKGFENDYCYVNHAEKELQRIFEEKENNDDESIVMWY